MTTTPSYSQHKEDLLIQHLFPNKVGTCIEVGANDGETFSNTKLLEERGWHCILIEPTPELCTKIRASRKGTIFECAASNIDGEAILYVPSGYDLFSSIETRSTMADEISRSQKHLKPITVRTRRLDSILEESGSPSIDFISIDVEGHELSVLQGLDLHRWRPTVVIIEDATDLNVTHLETYLSDHGYNRFYRSGGNDWYSTTRLMTFGLTCRMLITGTIEPKGLLKVFLPRTVLRLLLVAHRAAKRRWSALVSISGTR